MLLTSLLIKSKLKGVFGARFDGSPAFPYWRAADLGIDEKPFSFKSGKWTLKGSKYFIKGTKPKALVVFFHGAGDGRASYIKEISLIVKEGYLVYAYDNTGCMESEGNQIISFDHTVIDQKNFFAFLDNDEDSRGLKRYSIGHSWGGFGAMMSCLPQYKIEKCVSIAGFCKLSDLLMSQSGSKPSWFIKGAMHLALKMYMGKDGDASAIDVIKKSKSKVLYVYGDKDTIVTKDVGFCPLNTVFWNEKRVEFMEVKNIGHSVYKDPKAENYVGSLLKKGLGTLGCPEGLTMDLERATIDNDEVFQRIFAFYSN